MNKGGRLMYISCFVLGITIATAFYRNELKSNKKLTTRILSNSLQSMKSSKEIADSCALAYRTAITCVSNLHTCDFESEAKKLDEFNYKRGQAEEIIDWMSEDMKKIIQEVKSNP